MSILRQLLLSITLAITVILLGTLALNVTAARDYLADQLQAQSTDAAVSLALSLSQPGNSAPIAQELLIAALFDGGHFLRVALHSPEQEPLIVRQVEGSPQYEAPRWFRALVPIGTKSATRAVSDGWRQIGEVTVVANDVYAWEILWRSSLRMILLVVVAGLAWTAFAFGLVRWIERRLLAEISEQVRAIGQGELHASDMTPRVPELSGVTQALNQARERLRLSAAEQDSRVEALEFELNRDETTGIANRRYFLNEFRRALDPATPDQDSGASGTQAAGGHVMILHQRDLAEINRLMRRRPADQWLTSVCQQISHSLAVTDAPHRPQALLARLNGADFAVLMPGTDITTATTLAGRVRSHLTQTRSAPMAKGAQCRWVMALSDYKPGDDISQVLTRLDQGLTRSEQAGSGAVAFITD